MARLSIRTYPIRFAANEKNLRETWGLSKQELGEVAGVRESTVIAWEEGALQPSVDAAARIGAYFDIHPAVLLWGDEVRSENTPTIQMGMLSENDYKELLAMRDKNCGTLVLTENELDLVKKYRTLGGYTRHCLLNCLRKCHECEQKIAEEKELRGS